jgi:hypothetical protein
MGRTETIFEWVFAQALAEVLTIRTGEAQTRKYMAAIVRDFLS